MFFKSNWGSKKALLAVTSLSTLALLAGISLTQINIAQAASVQQSITLESMNTQDMRLRAAVNGMQSKDQQAINTVFGADAQAVTSETSGLRHIPATAHVEWTVPTPTSSELEKYHTTDIPSTLTSKTFLDDMLYQGKIQLTLSNLTFNGHDYSISSVQPTMGRVATTDLGTTVQAEFLGTLHTPTGRSFPLEILTFYVPGSTNVYTSISVDDAGWPIGIAFGKQFLTQSLLMELKGGNGR